MELVASIQVVISQGFEVDKNNRKVVARASGSTSTAYYDEEEINHLLSDDTTAMAAACSHLLLVDEDPFGRVDRDFDRYCGCNGECIHDEENDKTANECLRGPCLSLDKTDFIPKPLVSSDH